MEKSMNKLQSIRNATGTPFTEGLSSDELSAFLKTHPSLAQAIEEAVENFSSLSQEEKSWLKKDEEDLINFCQEGFLNFYHDWALNPYVPLAARGPWIVTCYGSVLHDSGGYGMLGLGHGPEKVLKAMGKNQVMANIMTASLSQRHLQDALLKEIGHTRPHRKGCFERFLCLNSGSESVTMAARISDLNAKNLTDPSGSKSGQKIFFLALKGGFHGRTDRPAQASDSSLKNYGILASFRDRKNLLTVTPNSLEELESVFKEAESKNIFIEMMFMEPVMGEGDPGKAITPEFYKKARELTLKHGSLLLVDSIQAGLRTHGVLSLLDYPGFQDVEAPDMETYSKALNAGQYPLSVLALNERAAGIFKRGIYGNTMTANPRSLDVACAVLGSLTPEIRRNISDRGQEFLDKAKQLKKSLANTPLEGAITRIQGTGLLCSIELDSKRYEVIGHKGIETFMRKKGIGVIHGGANSLRFTPHFLITSEEIDLILEHVRMALEAQ